MSNISDNELRIKIEEIVPDVDLETTSIKQFLKVLSKHFGGLDFSGRKKFVKGVISDLLNNADDDEPPPKVKAPSAKKKTKEKSKKGSSSDHRLVIQVDKTRKPEPVNADPSKPGTKPGSKGGLNTAKMISKPLADMLYAKETYLSRPEIVKRLWTYIKENDLQNPDDRREILLDENMQRCFGVAMFTAFSMNMYISCHIHPFKSIADVEEEALEKKRKKAEAAPKKKKRGRKDNSDDESDDGGKTKKKNKKTGTQPPYRLSPELSYIAGTDILPRPQVTQALWSYIKQHGLQREDNKKIIICDESLKKIFKGADEISMFQMAKYIGDHLVEKVDKSLYIHKDIGADNDESE
eukprot:CAMPEP_0116017206 /NCGR_PEP_ID=MMETSP0321-20121206/7914_1 /TAXON_ID=163516 /ORGANISM="Leptocylindrus danicus var. danicus, Strain B650" /LENGTH=351 /DNA_ID=CAMNT_0003487363 /DNA_START=208 /DNA_END=1263 /DNA_ORIENTATION=+